MENISSKFDLKTDGFRSCKTRNQNNASTHSVDCGSMSSLCPCKDCIEEFIWELKCRMWLSYFHTPEWMDGTPSGVD